VSIGGLLIVKNFGFSTGLFVCSCPGTDEVEKKIKILWAEVSGETCERWEG